MVEYYRGQNQRFWCKKGGSYGGVAVLLTSILTGGARVKDRAGETINYRFLKLLWLLARDVAGKSGVEMTSAQRQYHLGSSNFGSAINFKFLIRHFADPDRPFEERRTHRNAGNLHQLFEFLFQDSSLDLSRQATGEKNTIKS